MDHQLLFVRAMADFEAAHITVLSHLAQRAAFATGGSSPLEAIAELPGVGSMAVPVIATLERHGSIEAVPLDIARLFGEFYDNMPREPAPATPLPALRRPQAGQLLGALRSAAALHIEPPRKRFHPSIVGISKLPKPGRAD